jgi:hypothetical protein
VARSRAAHMFATRGRRLGRYPIRDYALTHPCCLRQRSEYTSDDWLPWTPPQETARGAADGRPSSDLLTDLAIRLVPNPRTSRLVRKP